MSRSRVVSIPASVVPLRSTGKNRFSDASFATRSPSLVVTVNAPRWAA